MPEKRHKILGFLVVYRPKLDFMYIMIILLGYWFFLVIYLSMITVDLIWNNSFTSLKILYENIRRDYNIIISAYHPKPLYIYLLLSYYNRIVSMYT